MSMPTEPLAMLGDEPLAVLGIPDVGRDRESPELLRGGLHPLGAP